MNNFNCIERPLHLRHLPVSSGRMGEISIAKVRCALLVLPFDRIEAAI
ncbi:hypothetical protein CKA32_002927 [Geitlerinema sp. FC II]|nr:hypothetical protein CKA32_002927 [Geitlerinema sp. FC II]